MIPNQSPRAKNVQPISEKKVGVSVNQSCQREKLTSSERLTSCDRLQKLTARMSEEQKAVLVYLYQGVRLREDYFLNGQQGQDPTNKYVAGWMTAACGGGGCRPAIDWQLRVFLGRQPTPSEKSSYSRLIRRLHDRGLIERTSPWIDRDGNMRRGEKAIAVTDNGRRIASRILGDADPFPNEADYQLAYSPGKTIEEIRGERERKLKSLNANVTSMLGGKQ